MTVFSPAELTIEGDRPEAHEFDQTVQAHLGDALHARSVRTIQVNIGLTCNLACRHCHVESSPRRDEQMDWPTLAHVLDAARRAGAEHIDITGGAPEMNPHFRRFVAAARAQGLHVMVRTNLTILRHAGYEDMPAFFRDHGAHLVASLPCYMEENVDRQRGLRVYDQSIDVLQRLNAVGYGRDDALPLHLVYNPLGPSLPPSQEKLEADYRQALNERFGIRFHKLYAIANLPIGRFLHDLRRQGRDGEYFDLLRQAFNPATLDGVMCRDQIHVSYDGTLHDCDFNYALGMPVNEQTPQHIRDFDPALHARRRIATGAHCFGCTAGHGSSCGGAIA